MRDSSGWTATPRRHAIAAALALLAAPVPTPLTAAEGATAIAAPAPAATAKPAGPTPQERVQRLGALVGTWETVDTYRPDSPEPIVERGVRTCALALRERYIECITIATNAAGREREYRFYLTWDGDRGRYTMLSFWSNVGGMALSTFTIDDTATVWDLRGAIPYVEDNVEHRTWSTLRFESPDRIVWEGRTNTSDELPTSWPVTFRETWQRQAGMSTP